MALTVRKRRYVEARLSGLNKKQSAIAAGYSEKTASQSASRLEKDADVLAAMGRLQGVVEDVARSEPPQPETVDEAVRVARATQQGGETAATTDDPLRYFVRVMNDVAEDPKLRLDAAKALASYTIPKPGEVGKKQTRQANAEKSASGGRFAAPSAPKLVVSN